MANLEQVIEAVRIKVSDYAQPRKFDSHYYESAISFALSKLSHDYNEVYSVVDTVPYEREFLLIKLAAIEMCYVRAQGTPADSDDLDSANGLNAVSSVEVPGLSVTQEADSSDDTADRWLKIATDLQAEYDNELTTDGGPSLVAEVYLDTVNRKSAKTGGLASRKLDRGLPAVTVTAIVDDHDVQLVWTKIFSDLFYQYEVYRASVATFRDKERIAVITDNHENEYLDSGVATGTYYYRVYTVNPNAIKTASNDLLVEVV